MPDENTVDRLITLGNEALHANLDESTDLLLSGIPSLDIVKFCLLIRAKMEVKLPLEVFADHRTISDLARYIDAAPSRPPSP